MRLPRRRRRIARSLGVATAVCAGIFLVMSQLPAGAITVNGTPSPVTGNATWFTGLGSPYGGCGLPQANLDSQNFIALNVFNTPGDYSGHTRPVPASQSSIMGMWDNGLNCGRWVQVSISDFCTGTNDGAPNMAFCRNGSYVADQFNGATLNMLVADSCADGNAWCRDDPFHIDLAQASLNQFMLNGAPVGNMYPDHWNNRHVTWQFIPAPNYSGDIQIGFLQGAQVWWPAISVSHLPNGIHGIDFLQNGVWTAAQMNSDMGQSYIIGGTTAGGSQFQIRVHDSSDQLLNNGRVYTFSLPSACGSQCSAAYTQTTYTTSDGGGPSASPSTGTTGGPSTSPSATRSVSPSASRTSAGPSGPAGACAVTSTVTSSWSTGYQTTITVTNNGPATSAAWTVNFGFPATQTIANSWNAVVSQSSQQVTANNQTYNAAIPPGGNTTWGMVVNGANQPLTNLSCTVR
jgi:hypothetical protein